MEYVKICDTKIGKIKIVEEEGTIIKVEIGESLIKGKEIQKDTEILQMADKQLKEYFDGERKVFDLPLNPRGTKFMKMVWNELLKIPYGETRTYKQIAENINNPKACRAVGMANNKNPIPIIIPCHRVIGSNGSLVGYALGLGIKEKLLNLEK